MKHIIWTPNSKNDPWIETICAIKHKLDHRQSEGEVEIDAPYIKRESRNGKCLECYGPKVVMEKQPLNGSG